MTFTSSANMRTLIICAGMLVTGACNTMLNKLQDRQCVNCDDPDREEDEFFESPVWQTMNMFVGETMCLIAFYAFEAIQRWRLTSGAGYKEIEGGAEIQKIKNAKDSNGRIEMTGTSQLYLWLPTLCDICATTLMNFGLINVDVSVYQMIRGAVVIFTGLFSVIFLKRKLGVEKWLSLGTIVLGVAIVGVASIVQGGKSASGKDPLLGIVLVLVAQILTATQFVVEEKIMERYSVEPLRAVGLEGIFGLVTVGLLIPILWQTADKTNPNGPFAVINGWDEMVKYPQIYGAGIGIIFSISFFNYFGLEVTRSVSATSRSTIDTSRTILVWAISLGLEWETFKWLQIIGFLILILGTFLFNGVIHLPPAVVAFLNGNKAEEHERLIESAPAASHITVPFNEDEHKAAQH